MNATPPPAGKPRWYTRTRVWYGRQDRAGRAIALTLALILTILMVLFLGNVVAACDKAAAEHQALLGDITGPTVTATAPAVPAATPSVLPTPSASASAPVVTSAPATSSPAVASAPLPAEPSSKISLNQMQPASDTTWMTAYKGTALNRVIYTGEFVSADVLGAWLDAAKKNGFYAEVDLDNVIDHLIPADVRAYGQKLAQHDNLVDFGVSKNSSNYDLHYQIAASVGAKPVVTWDNWSQAMTPVKPDVPIFLPFPDPNDYGAVSDYTKVGRSVVSWDGASGWAAVQGYGQWDSEPGLAAQFHFPHTANNGRPAAADVRQFAKLLHDQGVQNIYIYTEEPAADDTALLKSYIDAVAQVLGR